jgi:hypothetical protein
MVVDWVQRRFGTIRGVRGTASKNESIFVEQKTIEIALVVNPEPQAVAQLTVGPCFEHLPTSSIVPLRALVNDGGHDVGYCLRGIRRLRIPLPPERVSELACGVESGRSADID